MARPEPSDVSLHAEQNEDGALTLRLSGRLDRASTGGIWAEAFRQAAAQSGRLLILEASELSYCDGSGVGLLVELERRHRAGGGRFELRGLSKELRGVYELYAAVGRDEPPVTDAEPSNLVIDVGHRTAQLWSDTVDVIAFIGELVAALAGAALRPRTVRWRDALLVAEQAGVNGVPIVAMIGFLIGLIMAFQSAIPLRQFGAEIFVANLVSLSLVRELGPFVSAIILAGRSGSAFAAEIGTMKINEEVNALETMGLDPVRFLVVPRVLAGVFVMPLLTLVFNLFGLIGGGIVMLSLGFPLVSYLNQVSFALGLSDFAGGMIKAFAFGILVASIGCLRGLQTRSGASAVGDSTTKAVVSGIILIALADGVFSVLFFFLDI